MDDRGRAHIPTSGPVVLASNHVSYLDPLTLAWVADRRGRHVRYLAKAELFDKPVLGSLLRAAHQIPVRRGRADAGDALTAAVDALGRRVHRRVPRGHDLAGSRADGRQVGHGAARAPGRGRDHAGGAVGDAPDPDQGPQAALAVGHPADGGGRRADRDRARRAREANDRADDDGHHRVRGARS